MPSGLSRQILEPGRHRAVGELAGDGGETAGGGLHERAANSLVQIGPSSGKTELVIGDSADPTAAAAAPEPQDPPEATEETHPIAALPAIILASIEAGAERRRRDGAQSGERGRAGDEPRLQHLPEIAAGQAGGDRSAAKGRDRGRPRPR